MKCTNQIPTCWKNQETTSTVTDGSNFQQRTAESMPTCSAGTVSAFRQDGNIFSICCSTGEFLLHFLKIILTVIVYCQTKATSTNCYPFTDAAGQEAARHLHRHHFSDKQEDVHPVLQYCK
jgi:hypothetical protein